MFYVYILKSLRDNELYIGYTADLRRRFVEHNTGKASSTARRRPFVLIYYEAYQSKDDAMKREQMLKLRGPALAGLKRRIGLSLNA